MAHHLVSQTSWPCMRGDRCEFPYKIRMARKQILLGFLSQGAIHRGTYIGSSTWCGWLRGWTRMCFVLWRWFKCQLPTNEEKKIYRPAPFYKKLVEKPWHGTHYKKSKWLGGKQMCKFWGGGIRPKGFSIETHFSICVLTLCLVIFFCFILLPWNMM